MESDFFFSGVVLVGSGLTEKQRSLVIAVMCLLCYIGLGSLVFSFLLTLTCTLTFHFEFPNMEKLIVLYQRDI